MLLRREGSGHSPVAAALKRYLEGGVPVFLTGVIYQELLTGFRNEPRRRELIGVSGRIGICKAADRPWRFFLQGNVHVSKRRAGP